jgi:uncharacterized protein YgbK (DUF1537 family)
VTIQGTHYIQENDTLTPSADTEFARDSVFGYSTSFLPAYIEEKTGGRVKATSVIQTGGDESVALMRERLMMLNDGACCILNAERYTQLTAAAKAIREAIAAGKNFLFQSGASFVKAFAQVPDRPMVGAEALARRGRGVIIVGSHVKKTSAQVAETLSDAGVAGIEVDVDAVLAGNDTLQHSVLDRIGLAWQASKTPVVFTSRAERRFPSPEQRLAAGRKISAFLVDIVRHLPWDISFLIAKGGITSHDILVESLDVETATVLGQLLPGVPVIRIPPDNRFDGLLYVIFPGNVGDVSALRDALKILTVPPG